MLFHGSPVVGGARRGLTDVVPPIDVRPRLLCAIRCQCFTRAGIRGDIARNDESGTAAATARRLSPALFSASWPIDARLPPTSPDVRPRDRRPPARIPGGGGATCDPPPPGGRGRPFKMPRGGGRGLTRGLRRWPPEAPPGASLLGDDCWLPATRIRRIASVATCSAGCVSMAVATLSPTVPRSPPPPPPSPFRHPPMRIAVDAAVHTMGRFDGRGPNTVSPAPTCDLTPTPPTPPDPAPLPRIIAGGRPPVV